MITEARAIPLHETGEAPRVFVHDIDRLESLGDGIYCFVCTCPQTVDGHAEHKVTIYLDTTWRVIAKGILLSAVHVVELTCLREVLAHIKKAYARLTLH